MPTRRAEMRAILAHAQVLVAAAAAARSAEHDAAPSTALMMVSACAAPCAVHIFLLATHCLTRDAPIRCACAPIAGGRGRRVQRRGQLDRPRRRRLCGRRARGERHACRAALAAPARAPALKSSILSAPARAQAPDDASADDEAVRALLGTQFERGDAEDYVQLKDVAALLETHHSDCHARLCLKAGTRVPSNEALAAAPDGARERGSVEAGAVLRVPAVTLCRWRWVAPPSARDL